MTKQPQQQQQLPDVEDMFGSTVFATPITRDWNVLLGGDLDDEDAPRIHVASKCDKCQKTVYNLGEYLGEERHLNVDNRTSCEGNLSFAYPMMNASYLVASSEEAFRLPVREAALAIVHLPLALVVMDDNIHLALTGGGMDFSWEICEAYLWLGYLPPVHFNIRMDDKAKAKTPRGQWVLKGVRRSNEVLIEISKHNLATLDDIVAIVGLAK